MTRIEKLINRALWMEALYIAHPNRLTLWLWSRSVKRMRAEQDAPKAQSRLKGAGGPLSVSGEVFKAMVGARHAKVAAMQAQNDALTDYLRVRKARHARRKDI